MGIKHRFTKAFVELFGKSRVNGLQKKQRSLRDLPGIIGPTSKSPTRFEIPLEMMRLLQSRDDIEIRHIFPMRRLFSIIKNIHLSVDSIKGNPIEARIEASNEFLDSLEGFIQSLGVAPFGYVKLPHDLIFKEFGVLYDNAIILAMEMNKENIDKAPSQATLNTVFGTYDDLGIAANKINEYLRENGYGAQADHPLGGLVLFPPLAQLAGLGWVGKHGLLITPEYGPRVRLAAVYTDIETLPYSDSNPHGWIENYCETCGLCAIQCPPKAILDQPVTSDTGLVTHISQLDCFEYFAQNYGCSVCIRACPFSMGLDAYNRLRAIFQGH